MNTRDTRANFRTHQQRRREQALKQVNMRIAREGRQSIKAAEREGQRTPEVASANLASALRERDTLTKRISVMR